MEYKVSRKYKMAAQFEMLELGVEGLKTQKEIKKALDDFDLLAKQYKGRHAPMQEIPTRPINPVQPQLKVEEVPF